MQCHSALQTYLRCPIQLHGHLRFYLGFTVNPNVCMGPAPLHGPDGVPHSGGQRLGLDLSRRAELAVRVGGRVAPAAQLLHHRIGEHRRRAQHARHHVTCAPSSAVGRALQEPWPLDTLCGMHQLPLRSQLDPQHAPAPNPSSAWAEPCGLRATWHQCFLSALQEKINRGCYSQAGHAAHAYDLADALDCASRSQ